MSDKTNGVKIATIQPELQAFSPLLQLIDSYNKYQIGNEIRRRHELSVLQYVAGAFCSVDTVAFIASMPSMSLPIGMVTAGALSGISTLLFMSADHSRRTVSELRKSLKDKIIKGAKPINPAP